jgi:dipeptidase D
MSEAVVDLQPSVLWKHFEAISAIPRSSKNEAAVARYVTEVATRYGCIINRDKAGNLLIRCPATPGLESSPSICLQGHLDMVCEKNSGTLHDFMKDPIRLRQQGNLVKAEETTLGADNGIAVAAMLALLEDGSLPHGPLEMLLTVDEETGLTGARLLDSSLIQSRMLLNLDSEEEGAIYIGCSGGRDTIGHWKPLWENLGDKHHSATLTIRGLKGGHSGLDIDRQRGNAIKILGRLLLPLHERGVRIAGLQGGSKSNAIPREAQAAMYIPEKRVNELQELVRTLGQIILGELSHVDPDLQVELQVGAVKKGKVLKRVQVRRILQVINALPHGVIKMSPDISGLVQTSTNVGVISSGRKLISLATSQRSAVSSELDAIANSVASLLDLGGADLEQNPGYPGWKPNLESRLLELAGHTYERLYGKRPEIRAIHAGLECGIIGEKIGDIDMISFGPTIENAHSPDECLHIDTVDRFWNYLRELLRVLAAERVLH